MASIFLKSTTTLFVIISALSMAIALIDTDGDILRNGGTYYILPQSLGFGGGLTPTSGTEEFCPKYYITQDKETFPGSPITISSPLKTLHLAPGFPMTFSFESDVNICFQPIKAWQVALDTTTGQSYVAVIGGDFNPIFTIEDNNGEYKIKYYSDEEVKDVGFFEKNGFLGITNEIPLPVKFQKASKSNVLAMKI